MTDYNRFIIEGLIGALSGLPTIIQDITALDWASIADFTADPERFTIREIIAHLAEFDTIFLDRFQRTCTEENPELPGFDEVELARLHRYSELDVSDQYKLFSHRRSSMVAFLNSRSPDDWARTAERPGIGSVNLQQLVTITAMHDNYHIRQLTHWVATAHRKTN